MHLVLLPGLDGTGALFRRFARALPEGLTSQAVHYPAHDPADYDDLLPRVRLQLPQAPFVLLGESFSGPLAIRLAAERQVLGAQAAPEPRRRPARGMASRGRA